MSQITAGRKIAKRGKFKAKALICDSSACNHGAPRTPPHGVRGSSPIAGADPTTSYLDVIPEAKGKKYSAKNCNYTYLNLLILGLQILALAGKLQGNSGGVRSHSPMSFSPRGATPRGKPCGIAPWAEQCYFHSPLRLAYSRRSCIAKTCDNILHCRIPHYLQLYLLPDFGNKYRSNFAV